MMKAYILVAVFLSLCVVSVAQQPSTVAIREVQQRSAAVTAPRECLRAFRELFSYLQNSEPSIVSDEQAQKRWLTQDLRTALAKKVATFTSPQENPDYPSNSTFIGSWDSPSTYAIVASRRYGNRAIIDVLFKWGPNTNYPGDERTTSFIFLLEDGAWKLDDIYTFKGKFVNSESLSQYFREK